MWRKSGIAENLDYHEYTVHVSAKVGAQTLHFAAIFNPLFSILKNGHRVVKTQYLHQTSEYSFIY